MPIIINSKNVQAITQSVEKKTELENRAKYNFHQFINYALHVHSSDVVQCEVAIIMVDNGNSVWMEEATVVCIEKKTVV